MKRFDCLEVMAPLVKDEIVVTSGSGQRVEWGHLSQHDGNLFVGSLGNALGVGLGVALCLPKRKVIVLESDGSLLLSLFNLPTVANQNPAIWWWLSSTIKRTADRTSATPRPRPAKPISK